jgi:molecular chaperone GrpE
MSNNTQSTAQADTLHTSAEADAINTEQTTLEQDITSLLTEAQQQAQQHYNSMLLVKADMENLRRRTERDVDNAKKFALERFLTDLIPVLDSMEMGVQAATQSANEQDTIRQGMEMTLKMFQEVMTRFNVTAIDPTGQKFNPQEHEAITMQPSADHEPNTVMMTIQKGYVLSGRVVRPARVIISAPA